MTNFKRISLGVILSLVCSVFSFTSSALADEGAPTTATLKVVKVVVGGPKVASDFNLTVTGFTVVGADPINQTFAGSSEGQNIVFDFGGTVVDPVGHATVTEGEYTNYTTSYSEGCNTDIIPGDSITCTVTNTYNGYTVTITKSGTGSGTVTDDDEQIICGEDCVGYYPVETTVTLTATPNSGSNFTDTWTSGPCMGSNDPVCSFSISSNVTADAHFSLNSTGGGSGGGSGGGAGGPAPSSGGSGVPSGSGSSPAPTPTPTPASTPTPAVAGAFTSMPSVTSAPAVTGEVLGASTTLPRTGMPVGLTLFVLVLTGLLVNKKLKLV